MHLTSGVLPMCSRTVFIGPGGALTEVEVVRPLESFTQPSEDFSPLVRFQPLAEVVDAKGEGRISGYDELERLFRA